MLGQNNVQRWLIQYAQNDATITLLEMLLTLPLDVR